MTPNMFAEWREDEDLLSPREERVLRMYYGLGMKKKEGYTYEEIAEHFSVSPERIHEIAAGAKFEAWLRWYHTDNGTPDETQS